MHRKLPAPFRCRVRMRWPVLASFALAIAAQQGTAAEPAKIERHLLLDSRLIESTEGVTLRLGPVTKSPANPLFREDRPWEVRFDNLYPNVLFDEKKGRYRCWYSPFIVDPEVSESSAAERAE